MTSSFRTALAPAVIIAAGLALAGCETTGSHPEMPAALASGDQAKADKPLTRTEAAAQCWMKIEKGRKDESLDKRADFVNKCIDDKMKTAAQPADQKQAAPKPKT